MKYLTPVFPFLAGWTLLLLSHTLSTIARRYRTTVTAIMREFESEVTLPPNWLFCSSEHLLTVVSEDASG